MKTETLIVGRDDVERFIHEAIGSAISESKESAGVEYKKQWLTKEELKRLTGFSDRTIQNLRDSRQIPFSQHGRKIVYPTRGIERFLQEHVVSTRSERSK